MHTNVLELTAFTFICATVLAFLTLSSEEEDDGVVSVDRLSCRSKLVSLKSKYRNIRAILTLAKQYLAKMTKLAQFRNISGTSCGCR